jgi:hypothetical protein
LAGIFNWLMAGLERLRARGNFQEPPQCVAAKLGYRESQSGVVALKTRYVAVEGHWLPTNEVYDECGGTSRKAFAVDIREAFDGKVQSSIRKVDGKSVRVLNGIRLR